MTETWAGLPDDGPVTLERLDDDAVWHVKLATPKANILDMRKVEILSTVFNQAAGHRHLKAVILDSEGPHFSFGASVQEHLPGQYERMIPQFGALFLRMLDASVITVAAVRGQCLGGGLELASFCHRVIASPEAKMGQPEIVLGVFAPLASVFLSERMGRGAAEDLCLTGRSLGAEEARDRGLVDVVAADPADAARAWVREFLLPRSAASLRLAAQALREGLKERLRSDLERVERLYLDRLMKTSDAHEGLAAFMEKRPPRWSDA